MTARGSMEKYPRPLLQNVAKDRRGGKASPSVAGLENAPVGDSVILKLAYRRVCPFKARGPILETFLPETQKWAIIPLACGPS